jgi:hypothetical protein
MAWGGDNLVGGKLLRNGFLAPSSVMEQRPSYHIIDQISSPFLSTMVKFCISKNPPLDLSRTSLIIPYSNMLFLQDSY